MKDADLKLIASQVFGTPMLAHPAKLDNFLAAFGPRILGAGDFSAAIEAENITHRDGADYKVADGVAIVPLIGSLVHRGYRMNSSGMTAYQAFDRNMLMAQNDDSVHSIIWDMDTPGGQVAGAFDQAARLMQMRGNKKIVAVASDLSASAGYLLGCCADEVVVTQTGAVGSIGVVMAHMDRSKEMAEIGRAVTYIYAGDNKVAGNPYEPLPEDVKADLQTEINDIYQMFTAHVAKARGMTQQAVVDTQARMFLGQKAVDIGLADRVGTIETEFERLKASGVSRGAGSRRFATRNNHGSTSMSKETQGGGEPNQPAADTGNTGTSASVQTEVMELTVAELDKAKASSFEAGATAERTRITGIMAVGTELGMGDAIVSRMINGSQSLEVARDLMAGVKEDAEASTHINTSHSAGTEVAPKQAAIDTTAIYAARNGGVS